MKPNSPAGPIEPGTRCLIIQQRLDSRAAGVIVGLECVAVGRVPIGTMLVGSLTPQVYRVVQDTYHCFIDGPAALHNPWAIARQCLLPLGDPDEEREREDEAAPVLEAG